MDVVLHNLKDHDNDDDGLMCGCRGLLRLYTYHQDPRLWCVSFTLVIFYYSVLSKRGGTGVGGGGVRYINFKTAPRMKCTR